MGSGVVAWEVLGNTKLGEICSDVEGFGTGCPGFSTVSIKM